MTYVRREPGAPWPDWSIVTVEDRERLVTRPFAVVTAVTFLFFLYVGLQIPLIPRLIEEGLGGSEFDIGLNLAAFSVAAIAIRPFLGPWGDRYGRRVLMIAGSLCAGSAVLLMTLVDDRWLLLPLRGFAGIGEGAVFVGAATMISDLAPPHRRAEATSYFSIAVFGGIGIGPILGEALIDSGGFDRALLASAVVAGVAALCALTVPDNQFHPALDADDADHGSRHFFHRTAVKPGIVLAFAMAGFATFNAFMPEHAPAIGLDGAKWVFALYSVVCVVVRVGAARLPERLGLQRTVSFALVFIAVGLAALFAVASPFGVYAGTAVLALGMAFNYPALMAMTVNAARESERARVIATFTMFFEVGTAAGGILFGAIADVTSKRGGFLAGAVSAAIGWWFLRRRMPASREARHVELATAR